MLHGRSYSLDSGLFKSSVLCNWYKKRSKKEMMSYTFGYGRSFFGFYGGFDTIIFGGAIF
jgi:hypothetical protein